MAISSDVIGCWKQSYEYQDGRTVSRLSTKLINAKTCKYIQCVDSGRNSCAEPYQPHPGRVDIVRVKCLCIHEPMLSMRRRSMGDKVRTITRVFFIDCRCVVNTFSVFIVDVILVPKHNSHLVDMLTLYN